MGLTDAYIQKLCKERDQEIQMAQSYLYDVIQDEWFSGKMAAGLAHSNLAVVYQRRIDEAMAQR